MMRSIKSMLMGGAILLALAMCLTSCDPYLDDIFGEWSRPTGNNGNTKTTVAVKSVTLDQTTLTKAVGDDAVTLTATVDPSDASDKTVTWKSSDASIAAVDANGKVTFVAAGSATITATATNGTEDAADDKTAICEVTISAKKVNVESVKLDQTTLDKKVGDDAVTLTATVDPSDASDKTVTWKSSDASIAAVDANGKVTFVAAGSATITATATNGTEDAADDKTAECAVTVNAAAAARSLTLATTDDVGKIAGADGKIYATKADAEAVATGNAVAMIAYVGTASDCDHGLAIALADESSTMNWSTAGTTCSSKTATVGTWRLPSAKDWQYMFIGCGSSESYSAPTPGMSKSCSGLASKLTTAQGDALQTGDYWSSTESDPGYVAWLVYFDGSDASFYTDYVDYECQVRACLAF